MAEAGLRILNDAGTLQIDSNWISFALSAKGSITLTDDGRTHPQPMCVGTVTVPGTTPLIAFRSAGNINLERTTNNGNGTWSFRFRCQSSSPVNLDYWVFDRAANGIGAGTLDCGLRVLREDGSLAFDAATKPMRIVGVIAPPMPAEELPWQGSFSAPFGVGQTYTPSAGRTVAVVQGAFAFMTAQWDQGSYGNGTSPPQQTIGDGGNPPLGATWRYMFLESYHSTARVTSTGAISAGSSRFERWEGWYPFSTQPTVAVHGQMMHWLVDVTHY